MSKYNKGDKFEIEIEDILSSCADGKTRYLINGFSSLIFDDYGLDRLKQIGSKRSGVDWSKVPVDTPILVSNDGINWNKRYFAKYEDGKVHAWAYGKTSWTSNGSMHWKYTKLVGATNDR